MTMRVFRVWGTMTFGLTGTTPMPLGGRVAEVWVGPQDRRRLVRIGARGGMPEGVPALPPPEQNIHAAGQFAAVSQALAEGHEAVFWVSPPDGTPPPVDAELGGLHAIDQFENGAQTLRWPLVAEGSRLRFFRQADNNTPPGFTYLFQLKLQVALPVPLKVGDGGPISPTLDLDLTYPTLGDTDPLEPVLARFGGLLGRNLKLGSFGFDGRTPDDADRPMLNYGSTYSFAGRRGPDLAGVLTSCGLGRDSHNINKTAQIDLHAVREGEVEDNRWRYRILCARDVTLEAGGLVSVPDQGQHKNPFAIRLDALDSSLAVQSSVTAEVEHAVTLDDARLIAALAGPADEPPALSASTVRLRLRALSGMHVTTLNPTAPQYADGIEATPGPVLHGGTDPALAGQVLLTGGGLAEAARLQALGLQGLMTLASHPQSILAQMGFVRNVPASEEKDPGKVEVPVLIHAHGLGIEHRLGGGTTLVAAPGGRPPLTVTLDALPVDSENRPVSDRHGFDAWRSAPPKRDRRIRIRLSLPQFNSAQSDPGAGHRHRHVQAVYDPAAEEPPVAGGPVILIGLRSDPFLETRGAGHLRHLRGRLGALAFDGVAPPEGGATPLLDDSVPGGNGLRLAPRHRAPMDPRGTGTGQPPLRLELRYRFRLSRVAQVTTDIAHGVREEGADDLVIDEAPRAPDAVQRFVLDLRETLDDRHDRHLTATIFDTAISKAAPSGAPDQPANPDLAAAAPPATVAEPTTVIATQPFAVWRFARRPLEASGDAETAAVASYDSDRRSWEFRATAGLYRLTLPPGVTGETTDKPGRLEIHDTDRGVEPAEPAQDGVARVRMVEMRLAPPTELWFSAADLGRNFLRPELAAAELLVQRNDFGPGVALRGVRGELLYGLAFGLQVPPGAQGPQPRLAELAALVGRPPRPGPDLDAGLARRVAGPLRAIAGRPSRIEAITVDPAAALPFRPAVFERGLWLALRRTALIAPPVPGGAALETGPRMDVAAGLAGGALWPVEQPAILRRLLEEPVADGGRIEGLALSPQGASGDQEAVFRNGAIRIVSETRGGFVQRQRVEVLGRIAVFWHRARHVVVYERTTAPSAQFTPESGGATRSARPVLRKVEDYVEILEPVRRYPDLEPAAGDEAALRAPGFLRELRFGARRIAVDSAWGRDLGGWGWEVPLWNRGAAARRPQVYPEPDVALACDGGDGGAPVAQACLDADNIFFVTDAEAIAAGLATDDWPARPGIDHSARGAPEALEEAAEAALAGGPEGRRTALPRVLPGAARFTWRVAPAGRGVQVNAGLGSRPILAGLDSVTMMRGAPPSVALSAAEAAALGARLAPATDPAAGHAPWQVGTEREGGLGEVAAALHAVETAGPGGQAAALEALRAALTGRNWDEAIRARAARVLGSDVLPGLSIGPALAALKAADGATCARLAAQATAGIGRKRALIAHVLESAEADLRRAAETLDAEKLQAHAAARIEQALTGLIKGADPLGPLDDAAARARAALADWRADALRDLDRARDRLAAARAAYERGRAESTARRWAALAALAAELDRVQDEALAAWTEAEIRLASGLDGVAANLVARLARTIRHALGAGTAAFEALDARLGRALPADAAGRLAPVRKAVADWIAQNPDEPAGPAAQRALDGLQGWLDGLAGLRRDVTAALRAGGAAVDAAEGRVRAALGDLRRTLADLIGQAPVVPELAAYLELVRGWIAALATAGDAFDAALDAAAETGFGWLERRRAAVDTAAQAGAEVLGAWLDQADAARGKVAKTIDTEIAGFSGLLAGAALAPITALPPGADPVARVAAVQGLAARAAGALDEGLGALEGGLQAGLSEGCAALLGLRDRLIEAGTAYADAFKGQAEAMAQGFLAAWAPGGDPSTGLEAARRLARRLEQAVQDVEAAGDHARVYTDRVLGQAAGLLSGGAGAVPGRLLKLHAAATRSPELAALKVKAERLRLLYRDLGERIDTSAVNAAFDRLGDALRALGLDLRFDGLRGTLDFGEQMKDWDLRKMLQSFAGADLSRLLKGVRLPAGLRDQVRISHDLDTRAGRAWVQIDIDIRLDGRQTLFTAGPFAMHLRDTRLTAQVRLEADQDSGRISTTDSARIDTTVEAVVGGTQIVSLERTVIRFSSAEKLSVRVDPKGIRLNAALRFVQDTLGGIFPEDLGGMALLKENGVPVGFEHVFALPPMSLMFGTSGISNLALENAFALRAYPDFVVSNRFSLSKRELPFLFSFFIVGGTGFVRIEAEYRPLDGRLGVLVEVGIGGSAALGFSIGPVAGSVFITLSVVLTYRQGLGAGDRGLTVSVVLVIAGSVRLFGIATVYLGLMLTLSYHESGRIDAVGTLSVELRISRFIKLRFRTRITYKLRDGKATRQIEHDRQVGGDALAKAMELEKARRAL